MPFRTPDGFPLCCVTLFQLNAISRTNSDQRIRPCAGLHITNANSLQHEAFITQVPDQGVGKYFVWRNISPGLAYFIGQTSLLQ